MIFEITLFCILLLIYFNWRDNCSNRRPPGPWRIPLLGNLHQIIFSGTNLSHVVFDILAKKYGPIMSFKLGTKETIIVSSHEELRNIFQHEGTLGRPLYETFQTRSWGQNLGILFASGDVWNINRRFVFQNLKRLGFGRNQTMESVISLELQELIEEISKQRRLKIKTFLNRSLLNVIWSMVGGKRFDHDDSRLKQLVEFNEKIMKSGTFGSDLSLACPILRKLFPGLTGGTVFEESMNELHKWIRDMIEDYRQRSRYSEKPFHSMNECLIDAYLEEIDKKSSKIITEDNLVVVLLDIFQAGSDTSNSALSFALLYMILHPEVQNRVQEELDFVVGDGEVFMEHQKLLKYTQATINEVFRLSNPVVLIPRKVTKEFIYKGYLFNEGVIVTGNLYSVGLSQSSWKDPQLFRPERFIEEDVELKFSPFGYGRRSCMGEAAAKTAVFLYFTNLLKNFEFSKIPNEADPTTIPLPSFVIGPQPFELLVKRRNLFSSL